ncbi:chemotaxis protein CheR [Geothrix rubra]|uniref:protein-glutamate O-methyltransferase n=1 Tax=Geothrix rubra TaxID=2927977 RepID=A0ABQ5Q6P9_9BACT|nr:chemotaxis protein CheB [Geothrix rubra]GLH70362.1 chemotaxis protein CheR [Geothrix rubra]
MAGKRKDPKEQAIQAPAVDAAEPQGAVPEADPAALDKRGRRSGGRRDVPLPIVGIGASAGGLAAFEAFFSGMPAETDPGMAFVLVQHLAPDHASILTDLIRRCTRMQVFEVEDGMSVKPNCIYIIPPNKDMAFLHGTLQLMEPGAPRGQRLPIDFFFRSLAQDQRERAIGIVLSGTGSDGTMGVRAIKGEGGMVMAQNPGSTEYDGMPRSAIGTGLVDYELPPAEMAAQLIGYVAHAFGKPPRAASAAPPKSENALNKVFVLLRAQTGHDFSNYKPSTIQRRIERRMAIHQIDTMEGYLKYLHSTPTEGGALFRDLLIGVTSFFRDPAAFKALGEQVIPRILAGKSEGSPVRIWSAGCSTGEEAYSLAILLREGMDALKQSFPVQIFATDLDGQSIASARAGVFPASIATDLTPERLSRFFTAEPDGGYYRIHKAIRDMLVFSEQDLIKDPPFSKLDLISCRNLLIYMGGELQKKLIPLFHYALNPGGFLFQGTSETVGEFGDLFVVLDRKAKLYQRRDAAQGGHLATLTRIHPTAVGMDTPLPHIAGSAGPSGKQPLRELAEQALLRQAVPAGALVNGRGDILYLHGRTGQYLELPPGEPGIHNILKMAREGLRRELTTALHQAVGSNAVVRRQGLTIRTNGGHVRVNLTASPVTNGPAAKSGVPLYLIILDEPLPAEAAGLGPSPGDGGSSTETEARVEALKQELQAKEEYLKASNEELETANEELKSSNEEMQSVNEELQSTNEELETSKEELQSVNEELATVNSELQMKVADLTRANNDMNNLLAGTGIGTIFVDHQLRILRFTPAATRIINLILGDVGRPVGHIVSNLVGCEQLVADVQEVLDTLVTKEREVQTLDGRWYTMRIQLYRTLDNVIEGAVLTFVDITDMKGIRAALQESESLFRELAGSLPQLLWMCRPDGLYDYLSPQWIEYAGIPESHRLGSSWLDQVHPEDRGALKAAWDTAVATGEPFTAEFRLCHHGGDFKWFDTRVTPLRNPAGQIVKWFGLSRGIPDPMPGGSSAQAAAARRRESREVPDEKEAGSIPENG